MLQIKEQARGSWWAAVEMAGGKIGGPGKPGQAKAYVRLGACTLSEQKLLQREGGHGLTVSASLRLALCDV